MRITVDTNVLVSATFWHGDSERILAKAEEKELELVLSKEILEEFLEVLGCEDIQSKIKNKNLEMKRTIEKIASFSKIVTPRIRVAAVEDDPSDNMILECGMEGKVDYIVSQDKHLLRLKEFKGIEIITPKTLLKLIHQLL